MPAPKKKSSPGDLASLEAHHKKRLAKLWPKAPYVLRFTDWKDYPAPVLVISERRRREEKGSGAGRETDGEGGADSSRTFASQGSLLERTHLYGETLTRVLPILRTLLAPVSDDAGVPLELDRYARREAVRFRGNLPLDDEAGTKLALVGKLTDRVKDPERVELIARRIARFSREEAAYWYSRLFHFGPDAGRWAASGMKIVLGGEPGDPGIGPMLARLRLD
ncbi:MAG: hypothetical protein JNJ70_13115 [Verrucomicrobiales bacterium]|nr:hypothetical protein [Verrucomicrobiales bacterium]